MLRLKSKLSEIDRIELDGITTIIYFDEYYKVHKFEYSSCFTHIVVIDEFDDPSLKEYRVVMDLASNNKGC